MAPAWLLLGRPLRWPRRPYDRDTPEKCPKKCQGLSRRSCSRRVVTFRRGRAVDEVDLGSPAAGSPCWAVRFGQDDGATPDRGFERVTAGTVAGGASQPPISPSTGTSAPSSRASRALSATVTTSATGSGARRERGRPASRVEGHSTPSGCGNLATGKPQLSGGQQQRVALALS